jgi:hypothetical protein
MLTVDGWLDWASRRPGPIEKQYTERNASAGFIFHSQVGFIAGAYDRLFSMERDEAGRFTPYAAASWTMTLFYDGRVEQHYPIGTSCWTHGSRYPNTHFDGCEVEGGPPGNEAEPLRPAQFQSGVRIIADVSRAKVWTPRRPISPIDGSASCYLHSECVRWGSLATACPSGRIPWPELIAGAAGVGDDMASAEYEELKTRITQEAALRELVAAAADDDMKSLIAKLALFGVVAPGTVPLKASIIA